MKFLLLLIISFAAFTSCVTRKACEQRYGECGEVRYEREVISRDSTIYLAGATVTDSVPYFVQNEIVRTDSAGLVRLKFYYDAALKRVMAACERLPDTVKTKNTIIREKETKYVTKEVEVTPIWIKTAAWVSGGLALLFFISRIFSFLQARTNNI